ncbi:hypothetical protein TRIP_B120049 [uncultured Desulfatiglans sp.]|nr:hypothetical protein TRIP_B120049 [uncultured Desulfatiglans sp.]
MVEFPLCLTLLISNLIAINRHHIKKRTIGLILDIIGKSRENYLGRICINGLTARQRFGR